MRAIARLDPAYDIVDDSTVRMRLGGAMDFLETFSYTDNWQLAGYPPPPRRHRADTR